MFLVLMVSGDRVIHVKAFKNFDKAAVHADEIVMDQRGVTNEMPNWENSDYRTVFTTPNGISVMIEPCEEAA